MCLRRVLPATLAASLALIQIGCRGPCEVPERSFELDTALTVEDLDEIALEWGLARGDLACHQVCQSLYTEATGWETTNPDTCELIEPVIDEDGEMVEEGQIACAGTAREYGCP